MDISSGKVESTTGIDSEGDTIGVVLAPSLICGTCMEPMQRVKGSLYQCPNCGMTFNDSTA